MRTQIPRYLDSLPQVLWWELDEFILFIVCLMVGIFTRYLWEFTLIGCVSVWAMGKVKGGQSEGFILHMFWWYGIPGFMLEFGPSSEIGEFLE